VTSPNAAQRAFRPAGGGRARRAFTGRGADRVDRTGDHQCARRPRKSPRTSWPERFVAEGSGRGARRSLREPCAGRPGRAGRARAAPRRAARRRSRCGTCSTCMKTVVEPLSADAAGAGSRSRLHHLHVCPRPCATSSAQSARRPTPARCRHRRGSSRSGRSPARTLREHGLRVDVEAAEHDHRRSAASAAGKMPPHAEDDGPGEARPSARSSLGHPRLHVSGASTRRATARRAPLGAGRRAPHGTLVTAGEQTAGRGAPRGAAGRRPPDSALLMSLVLRPQPFGPDAPATAAAR